MSDEIENFDKKIRDELKDMPSPLAPLPEGEGDSDLSGEPSIFTDDDIESDSFEDELPHEDDEGAMDGIGVFVLHWGGEDNERKKVTIDCVESWLDEAEALDAVVTIIDNGSPTKFVKPKKWGKRVAVMRLDENLMLIDAFNEAMELHPAGVYVCITNDTQKADYPLIAGLVGALADKKIGIIAPGTNDKGAGTLFVPVAGMNADHQTKHVDNTVWAWRHDLIDAIGYPSCEGHDDRACWYSNKDYCARARKAGYRVVAGTGSAYVVHAHMGGQDTDAHEAGLAWLKGRVELGLYSFDEAW